MQQQASQRELISPPVGWLLSLLGFAGSPGVLGDNWEHIHGLLFGNQAEQQFSKARQRRCSVVPHQRRCSVVTQNSLEQQKNKQTSSILIPQVRDLSIFGPLCFPTKEGASELHSQPSAAMESEHLLSTPWRMLAGLPWWFSGEESTSQCRGHSLTPGPKRLYMPRGCVPQPESLRDAVKTLSAATKTQGRQINK